MFGVMVEVHEASASVGGTVALPLKASSIAATSRNQGSKKLMKRFLGRQSTMTKDSKTSEAGTIDEGQEDVALFSGFEGLVTPCPFIRPLEHKLEARSEPRPLAKLGSATTTTTGSSAIAIAMHRGEANRILNGRLSDEGLGDNHEVDLQTDPSIIEREESTQESIDLQISQQLEYVAVTAAHDAQAVQHWRYYIECYSKGQFNLIDPPHPPPRNSSFEYLPAVFPECEAKRMSLCSSFDILWPQWAQDKAGALIRAAMKKFDTRFAALSFFDGRNEMFKAENGYNRSHVSRSVSIAAHALLSADVLVVLDTKQDWRFEGNPLVNGRPKIRFFAGAPMLSADGHPVGVFAIFGREPRATFTPFQRRELAEFSSLAMTDLNLQTDWLSDPDLRSTPILQRESVINCDYRPTKVKSANSSDLDTDLVPPALRYHKVATPPGKSARLFLNRQRSRDVLSDYTPPSSSGESDEGVFVGSPKGFGKNHKKLSVNVALNQLTSYPELITPDSESFAAPSPRPFSASDLTSLNPQPPNTPVLLAGDALADPNLDLTVENFMCLSDKDCAEEPSSPLIDLSSPKGESDDSEAASRQSPPPLEVTPSRYTGSTISTALSGHSHESSDPMAEAAFACAFSAKNLGYDLIYVVEIRPLRPFMTDQELLEPNGLQKRILVAYGLDRPLELSSEVHIRVLRSRGYDAWENNRAKYEDDEYQSGCLIPIQTEGGPRRFRSTGIIFGAFRRPKQIEVGGAVQNPSADMERLLDAAMVMKDILLKPNVRRQPKRPNTEPPTSNRYPAHEAIEVGKSSPEARIDVPV